MKSKFKILFVFICLLASTTVYANEPIESKLSLTSTWRIEQAVRRCDQSNNELTYKEYWGDSPKPENQKTICIAEQFADQVAADGDGWIEASAGTLVEKCEQQSNGREDIYSFCLKRNLEKNSRILSVPCKELGEKKLWDQRKCEHLVSYIFMTNFDDAARSNLTLWDKITRIFDRLSKNIWVNFFINPVTAILAFILFVLDVVFLIEKGTWMRVTKIGLIIGFLLIIASFTKGGLRLFLSGFTIIVIFSIIGWNHRAVKKKPEKKKPIPIEF